LSPVENIASGNVNQGYQSMKEEEEEETNGEKTQ